MMNLYTPGPWTTDGDNVKAGLRQIATCYDPNDSIHVTAISQANAHLIAAAPDLLACCKELVAAVAAAMRVIADLDAMKQFGAEQATREQRLVDELKVSGVVNGFGVRANAAIQKADPK